MGKDKKPNEPIMRRAHSLRRLSLQVSPIDHGQQQQPQATLQDIFSKYCSTMLSKLPSFEFDLFLQCAHLQSEWTARLISQLKDEHLWNWPVALTWDHMITLETPCLFASNNSSWQIVSLSNRDSASNCSCRFSRSCHFLAVSCKLLTKMKLNYLK